MFLVAACGESPFDADAQLDAILGNPRGGGGSYSRAVLSDAPLSYWRFEERSGPSRASDTSGNDHDGTYVGGPTVGDSVGAPRTGEAMSLENERDGMRVEYAPWTDMAAVSVEAWVRPRRVTSSEGMILVDKGFTWNLFLDPDGRPAFQFPGDIPPETMSPTPLVAGETYHLVGTFQDGVMKLFVNGEVVDEATLPESRIPPREQPIHVGRGVGAVRFELFGVIDEVALYDRALSEDAILGHWSAGAGSAGGGARYADTVLADAPVAYWRFEEHASTPVACDCSGNDHHGIYVGGPVLGDSVGARHTGHAMSLQNESDGVLVEYARWTDVPALSVEAWVRPSRITSPEGMIVVDKGYTWNLFLDTEGRPAFQFPGDIPPETLSPIPLTAGETYHLVGTFADGVMKLYVNGELMDEATLPVSHVPPREEPIHIGRGLGAARFEFYGVIDDVALYDRALSQDAVLRHYHAGA